jgi:hypothetical protein
VARPCGSRARRSPVSSGRHGLRRDTAAPEPLFVLATQRSLAKTDIEVNIDINGSIIYLWLVAGEEAREARDSANLSWAANRERLLPGEPVKACDSQDAEHWIAVYEELVSFNRELIELVEKRLKLLPASEDNPEAADLLLLQAHLGRLIWRLEHWRQHTYALVARGISS